MQHKHINRNFRKPKSKNKIDLYKKTLIDLHCTTQLLNP